MAIEIKTNNVERNTLDGTELTDKERAEFDYIFEEDLPGVIFVRYKGIVYNLDEFMTTHNLHNELSEWDGYNPDSFFSGQVVRFPYNDMETVVIGQYFVK